MKDSLLGRIPHEYKDHVRDHRDRVKTFFNEEYFPPERREQFIFRFKKVCLWHMMIHNNY